MGEWTVEQKLEQASGNAIMALMLSIAYVEETGQSIEDWARFGGKKLARGWDAQKGSPAIDTCKSAVFNPISMGATLVSLEGDDNSAVGVFDWDLDDSTALSGVSVDNMETVMTILYDEICDYLGINFSSDREGNRWTYTLSYD